MRSTFILYLIDARDADRCGQYVPYIPSQARTSRTRDLCTTESVDVPETPIPAKEQGCMSKTGCDQGAKESQTGSIAIPNATASASQIVRIPSPETADRGQDAISLYSEVLNGLLANL